MEEKYLNSIIFLNSARNSLNSLVESNINISKHSKMRLKNFFLKEATNYEILNILVLDKLPKERFNIFKEHLLYESLKQIVSYNLNYLTEFYSFNGIKTFLFENELLDKNYGSTFLSEAYNDNEDEDDEDCENLSGEKRENCLERRNKRDQEERLSASMSRSNPSDAINTAIGAVSTASGIVYNTKAAMNLPGEAKETFTRASHFIRGRPAGYFHDEDEGTANILKRIKLSATNSRQAIANFLSKHKGKIGKLSIAAIISLGVFIAVKAYKKRKAQSKTLCGNLKGVPKRICMLKNEFQALTDQKNNLNGAFQMCNNTPDPRTCKLQYQAKMREVFAKLNNVNSELKSLSQG